VNAQYIYKSINATIIAIIMLVIGACSYVAPPRDPYTLVLKLDAEPANLNPIIAPDSMSGGQ